MINPLCKPKKVNCANSIFLKQTILEAKLRERSEWSLASTLYERRWDMNVKITITTSHTYSQGSAEHSAISNGSSGISSEKRFAR